MNINIKKFILELSFFQKILIYLNIFFFIQMFIGENNIINYSKYKTEFKKKQIELNILIEKKKKINNILALLNNNKINNDYFDEIVREKLNYSNINEKIIIINSFKNNKK